MGVLLQRDAEVDATTQETPPPTNTKQSLGFSAALRTWTLSLGICPGQHNHQCPTTHLSVFTQMKQTEAFAGLQGAGGCTANTRDAGEL